MSNTPASSYLIDAAIKYLSKEANKLGGVYSFERNELVHYLTDTFPNDPKNTEGARTGALNRLFDSNPRITKVAHGKYLYSELTPLGTLTNDMIINELQEALNKIDGLTDNLSIIDTFTKKDRKVLYNIELAVRSLKDLISEIEK